VDLIWIVALSSIGAPVILLTSGVPRIVLALPLALFFPGYALLAALFPKKDSLEFVERISLSIGVSVGLTPLVALALNYTPWGLHLQSLLGALFFLVLALACVAWYRRRSLVPEERPAPRLPSDFPLSRFWSLQGGWNRVLLVVLAVSALGGIATAGYVVANPAAGERFTEFYMLGPGDKMEQYPSKVSLGDRVPVTFVVVNNELEVATYEVESGIDGGGKETIGPTTLESGEKWEGELNIPTTKSGRHQKVELLLYKAGVAGPYRELHLWIDVEGPGETVASQP